VKNIHHLVEHEGYDPLHAAYIAAQNLLAFFAESVSTFDEFAAYCDIVGAAEDAYMPGGPPFSPLTVSYFTTWALFDVRFGPDQETIGTVSVNSFLDTFGPKIRLHQPRHTVAHVAPEQVFCIHAVQSARFHCIDAGTRAAPSGVLPRYQRS